MKTTMTTTTTNPWISYWVRREERERELREERERLKVLSHDYMTTILRALVSP